MTKPPKPRTVRRPCHETDTRFLSTWPSGGMAQGSGCGVGSHAPLRRVGLGVVSIPPDLSHKKRGNVRPYKTAASPVGAGPDPV